MAFNFRAALALSMAKGKPEMEELQNDAVSHQEMIARATAAGTELRRG